MENTTEMCVLIHCPLFDFSHVWTMCGSPMCGIVGFLFHCVFFFVLVWMGVDA